MRLGRWVPFTLRSWRNARSVPAGYKVVAVVVMRENESAVAKKGGRHSPYLQNERSSMESPVVEKQKPSHRLGSLNKWCPDPD